MAKAELKNGSQRLQKKQDAWVKGQEKLCGGQEI